MKKWMSNKLLTNEHLKVMPYLIATELILSKLCATVSLTNSFVSYTHSVVIHSQVAEDLQVFIPQVIVFMPHTNVFTMPRTSGTDKLERLE